MMIRPYTLLLILSSFLISIKAVQSIECYQCESRDGSNKGCESSLSNNVTKGPCKNESDKVCFKMVGYGTKSKKYTILRGCYSELLTTPYKNFTEDNPFTKEDYNIAGQLYTCDTNYCNSSNNLKYSLILMATLLGFLLFCNSKSCLMLV